jgi:hypothetical protein
VITTVKQQRGAVMTEGAIITLVLFVTLFTFLHLGLYIYQMTALQFAVDQSLRRTSIGNVTLTGPAISIRPLRRGEIQELVMLRAKAYGVKVDQEDIRVCLATDPNCSTTSTIDGGSNEILLVQANRQFPWFGFNVTAQAIGRPEGS